MGNMRRACVCLVVLVLLQAARAWPDCSPQLDGHYPHNGTAGAFEVSNYTAIWQDHPLVVIHPLKVTKPAPLFVFMHGSTGRLSFYDENLRNVASHGFVVVFPYIKDPKSPY